MRYAILAVLTLTPYCSAAPLVPVVEQVTKETVPDTSNILPVAGRFAFGHLCPIGDKEALTAAHVVDIRPFDKGWAPFPVFWSRDGVVGRAEACDVPLDRDIAHLHSETPFPSWYALSDSPPVEGEYLWMVGYDWGSKKNAMAPKVIRTKVLRTLAYQIIYDTSGLPGSSGSCLLDQRGRVVGINVGGIELDSGGMIGIGVGVWGNRDWHIDKPVIVAPKELEELFR